MLADVDGRAVDRLDELRPEHFPGRAEGREAAIGEGRDPVRGEGSEVEVVDAEGDGGAMGREVPEEAEDGQDEQQRGGQPALPRAVPDAR